MVKEKNIDATSSIILFDGVCSLCNSFAQFVIKRDQQKKYQFAALQSEIGQSLIKQYEVTAKDLSTVILIEQNKIYLKSDAALKIISSLGGFWTLASPFIYCPLSLRNWVYDFIANHRYRWFGKEDQCMIPTPDIRERFLDI